MPEPGDARWRVRIEVDGRSSGAGLLLDGGLVLTVAHVVDPGLPLAVWLAGKPGQQAGSRYAAEVVPGFFHPAPQDTADVAVLRLREPVPDAGRVRLQPSVLEGQVVWLFGYPRGNPHGEWVTARVARSNDAGRVQLDVLGNGRVARGFSGAAASLDDTGEVVGIVATTNEPDGRQCWIIPVDVLRGYADEAIERHIVGDVPSSEQDLVDTVREALTGQLRRWTDPLGPGGVCAVAGTQTADLLARLIASPAWSGRVDAAVDADGLEHPEVLRRLAGSLHAPPEAGTALERLRFRGRSPVVAVTSVDAARDPVSLCQALRPFAANADHRHVRLLLSFASAAALRAAGPFAYAVAAAPHGRGGPPPTIPAGAADRLDHPAGPSDAAAAPENPRADELSAEETAGFDDMLHDIHARTVALRRRQPRFAKSFVNAIPEPWVSAHPALHVRLAVLREVAGSGDSTALPWLHAEAGAFKRAAHAALWAIDAENARLGRLLADRAALRGRLTVYRAVAQREHEEEEKLSGLYAQAHRLLWQAPCDLDAAETAVRSYGDAAVGG